MKFHRYLGDEAVDGAAPDEQELKKKLLEKVEERKKLKETSSELLGEKKKSKKRKVDDDGSESPKKDEVPDEESASKPKKRKKKKKKTLDESTNELKDETTEPTFTILGTDQNSKKEKLKRVLPQWLAKPSIVPVDLKNLSDTIDSIPELEDIFIEKLKKNNITHFFPGKSF